MDWVNKIIPNIYEDKNLQDLQNYINLTSGLSLSLCLSSSVFCFYFSLLFLLSSSPYLSLCLYICLFTHSYTSPIAIFMFYRSCIYQVIKRGLVCNLQQSIVQTQQYLFTEIIYCISITMYQLPPLTAPPHTLIIQLRIFSFFLSS